MVVRSPAGARAAAGARTDYDDRYRRGAGIYGLDGGALYHNHLTNPETLAVLDEFQSLGMKTVVVTATRYKTTSCVVDAYGWWAQMPGHLGVILDACSARGLEAYVGLVESSNVCGAYETSPNITHDTVETGVTIQALLASYGAHPALQGWYIINEQALPYEQRPEYLDAQAAYFLAIRNKIREYSALPIIVAPYFGNADGQGPQTPDQLATKCADFVADTGGDIILWFQDSVGADTMNVGWLSRTGDRAWPVRQYYEAIVKAVGADQCWADVEVFNSPSSSFSGAQYRPASVWRVSAQLAAAASCGRRMCWLPSAHMTASNDDAYAGSARLLASYKAMRGLGGLVMAQPAAYTWLTAPESGKPDNGWKLFDHWAGDRRNVTDPSWIGFPVGNVQVKIDLGSTKTVRWICAHCVNDEASAYRAPTGIIVEYSLTDSGYAALTEVTNTFAGVDAEATVGNTTVMSISARWLKITLSNASQKSLVSEMEIVVDG